MNVTLERVYLETETVGSIYVDGVKICNTLELPDKQNQRSISCIPEGFYKTYKEAISSKHEYPHFRLINVPNRSGILIHKITYVKDLRGCIGVGRFKDLNGDNVPDIVESGITLQKLYDMLPAQFTLTIKKKDGI